ncbi:hypothetical protein DFH09DRAFT_1381380 [Mycena vulgaris]|nr:hypothetical protein DFH09DRAFT_1381380 [Mycena vulgaris]
MAPSVRDELKWDLAGPLSIPEQESNFPDLYEVTKQHVKCPDPKGHLFLAFLDFENRKEMAEVFQKGFKFTIPRNGEDSIRNFPTHNIEIMEPGGVLVPDIQDKVFVRNSSGDGSQARDIMITWQADITQLGPDLEARALKLQDEIIGPEDECGPNKPEERIVDGEVKLVGGFRIERNWRAVNLEGAPRAYPISTSVQVPKGDMHAPAVGNKFYGLTDEGLSLRKTLMEFTAEVSMLGLECGPPGLAELLHDQGEIMNVPPVGSSRNRCFSAMQLNITHPTTTDAGGESIEDIGFFGGKHLDKGDEPGGVTAASSLSRLEPGIHPGVILILELGIALVLRPLIISFFCGLRGHGGTTPTYNPRMQLTRMNNIRALMVAYMTSAALGGRGISAFAALPENKLLTIGPELRSIHASLPENTSYTEQANYVADGVALMNRRDHVTWSAREGLILLSSVMQQLPYNVRIDRKKLLEAISWEADDGSRKNVGDWELGPGYAEDGELFNEGEGSELVPYGNKRRWDRAHEFMEHATVMGSSIPVVNLLCQRDEAGNIHNGRPATMKALQNAAAKGKNVLTTSDVLAGRTKRKYSGSGSGGGSTKKQATMRARNELNWGISDVYLKVGREFIPLEEAAANSDMEVDDDCFENDGPQPPNDDGESEIDSEVEKRRRRVIKIFDPLTEENLAVEINRATQVLRSAAKNKRFSPDARVIKLETALQKMAEDPLSADSVTLVGSVIRMSLSLYSQAAMQEVVLHMFRQRVMIASGMVWKWMHITIPEACKSMVSPSTPSVPPTPDSHTSPTPTWLSQLAAKIQTLSLIPKKTEDLKPGDYLHLAKAAKPYRYCAPRPGSVATSDERLKHVAEEIMRALMQWLGFKPEIADAQGWFAHHLMTSIGSAVLLLDTVWDSHQHIAARVIGERRLKVIKPEDLAPFKNRLKSHPISQPTSNLFSQIQKLGSVYNEIRKSMSVPGNASSATSSASTSNMSTQIQQQSSIPWDPTTDSPGSTVKSPRPDIMLRFLRIAVKAIPGHHGTTTGRGDIQQRAEKAILDRVDRSNHRSDHIMPLRQYGQSYLWISKPGGPFSPEHIRTRAGFFSVLLWRAVTFHAPIVEHHQLFQSLEEWEKKVADLQPAEYARADAYGGWPNKPRVTAALDTARTIWRMTGRAKILEWLTAPTKPRYMEMYQLMLQFPQVGNLIAHLLVSDYVYHGIIEMPSVQEMGEIIHTIKAGALDGLVRLGYLDSRDASKEEVINAFESLYGYLDTNLTPEEKILMCFNPIMLEHLLCKMKRIKDLKDVQPLWSQVE